MFKNFISIKTIMCFIIILIVSYLIIYILNIATVNNEEFESVAIYYVNSINNELEPIEVLIPVSNKHNMVSTVLTKFMSPPSNINHLNVFPEEVEIESFKFSNNGDIIVTFSEEYNYMTFQQEILGRSALVWTLTDIKYINNVIIYVGEQELLRSTGEPVGNLNRYNVLLRPQVSPTEINTIVVNLYFGNEDLTGLLIERRVVSISSDRTIEEQVLEELLKGSEIEGYYLYVPPDTRVLDANTIDNIAYIDLSSEFDTRHNLGKRAQELAIYSIVNSLMDIYGVEEVQFLIESQKLNEFSGYFDLSQPFKRNEKLIIR